MIHKTSAGKPFQKFCVPYSLPTQLCMTVATGKKQMVTAKYTSVLYAMLLLKMLLVLTA